MSGRLCQWAHWEGWVSGWSRGKQPSKCTVNNQSIRDYYTDSTEISPPSRNPESVPFWENIALIARIRQTPCFFNFLKKLCLRVYVCVRVCVGYADQVGLRLHVASTPSLW